MSQLDKQSALDEIQQFLGENAKNQLITVPESDVVSNQNQNTGNEGGRTIMKVDYISQPFKYKDSTKKLEYSLLSSYHDQKESGMATPDNTMG